MPCPCPCLHRYLCPWLCPCPSHPSASLPPVHTPTPPPPSPAPAAPFRIPAPVLQVELLRWVAALALHAHSGRHAPRHATPRPSAPMQPLGSQVLAPNPKTVARLRSPERHGASAQEQPASSGEAATGGQRHNDDNGRQTMANMAAEGGDDGELHVDEVEHVPWRVVSPRKPPPPPGGGAGSSEAER